MKLFLIVSLLLTALALLLPLAFASAPGETPAPEPDAPAPYYQVLSDASLPVSFRDGTGTVELTMDRYLYGAVAAEMPASFAPEALKAQAVALRSYVLHKSRTPTAAHPDAVICSDPTCCAAWLSDAALRERWGSDLDTYAGKIKEAIRATDGLVLTYGGEAALAVFHAASNGRTEASQEVWQSALPYLTSVDSHEDGDHIPGYVSSVTVSAQEFRDTVAAHYPDADLSGPPASWLGDVTYTDSGRVRAVAVGGVSIPGTALRSLFGLRSAAIDLSVDGETITMTTTGFGHGVGMSQYGADQMARDGADFREILENFYPGTALTNAGAVV